MNALNRFGLGLMLGAVTAFSANAQTQKTVRFGLQVLPSMSWFSSNIDDLDADARFNFSFGLLADIHFSEQYAITTGMNIVKRGASMVLLDGTLNPAKNVQGDYTMSLIEFPLALKMRLVDAGDIVPFAKFGGAFGIKTNEKTTFSYDYPDATVAGDRFHNVDRSDLMTDLQFNFMIGGGVEYPISANSAILLGIDYMLPLNDALSDDEKLIASGDNYRLQNLQFTVGFIF
ncbi:outer membrane beta-barrel protein [bacterium]|nr:outer membrane beta-barrel protein [bacterium]